MPAKPSDPQTMSPLAREMELRFLWGKEQDLLKRIHEKSKEKPSDERRQDLDSLAVELIQTLRRIRDLERAQRGVAP
ncbi:MAG TPA: hypothetical protein VLY82_02760 [Nitrososphaerales archaeon]|nr:hypothetical protein [Nitrososphaerales archaeon]